MKRTAEILILLAVLSMLVGCGQPAPTPTPVPTAIPMQAGRLLLATTTSTRDSGLLDFILPDFEG